jgi:RHS repeat-associated protein
VPQGNLIAPFGFTGELQDSAGMVHLRARWYDAGAGRFHARDPFAGWAEQPYSTHYYQYAYSDPVFYTDPSGLYGDPSCRLPSTMQGPPRCPQPDYVHPFIYNMLPHNAVFLTPLAAEQFRSEVLAAARHELQAQRDQEIVFYSVAGTALTACSGLAVIDVPTKLATAIMIRLNRK